MKEAKTHLLNGMNVSEASFAVGISDPNYFTKCFKKEFNITPTEFLKQLKQKAKVTASEIQPTLRQRVNY